LSTRAANGERMQRAADLRSAASRFPRSEPQASGERRQSALHPRSAAHRFPRSEPQASGEFSWIPRSEPKASGEFHQGGFTLIEMLAVVAIFGLIAAMVLPNIDLGGSRVVKAEADDMAAAIEFARQRAVMTGRTHQVVIEIERGEHWVEWAAPADTADGAAPEEAAAPGERQLDLVPPILLGGEEFEPIPGEMGRVHRADDATAILGVEVSGDVADQGRVELRITPDGAADAAAILLGDADGGNALRIEIEPLADAVRVVHAD
jgi:type II secretion system protein H